MKRLIYAFIAISIIFTIAACSGNNKTSEEVSAVLEDNKASKQEQVIEPKAGATLVLKADSDLVKIEKPYLPNAEFDVMTSLLKGDEAKLVEAGVEWHKVLYDGQEGYVLAMDVEGIDPLPSPYYIYIEKGSHTINVYEKGDDGEYSKLIKTFLTATGITAGKTPTGVFSVSKKYEWKQFDSAGVAQQYSYSPYVVQFTEGIYIHGSVYGEMDFNTMYGNTYKEIGTNSTAGCMRTNAGAAYWIYMNCPMGTTVEVVNGSPREIKTPELIKPIHDLEKGRYFDPTDPNRENPIEP
jgi:hypothetical protein